jgi:hypothetical protein
MTYKSFFEGRATGLQGLTGYSTEANRARESVAPSPSMTTLCLALNGRGPSEANNEKVQQLASDEALKTAQNVAAGVAGFVVPILWFGMDFQGSANKEVAALQARQQYLAVLVSQRCTPPGKRTAT